MPPSHAPNVPFSVTVILDREDVVELVRLSNNSRVLTALSGLVAVPIVLLGVEPGPPSVALLQSPAFLASIFVVFSAYIFSPLVVGEFLWRRLPHERRRTVYQFDQGGFRPGALAPIPFSKIHHYRRSARMIAVFADERGAQGFAFPAGAFDTPAHLSWLDEQLAGQCATGRLRWWGRLDPLTRRALVLWPIVVALFVAIQLVK
jgi:hypothetical protein